MTFPFALPPAPRSAETPVWTGRGFQIGQKIEPVLCYHIADSGWTDELTEIHESYAGDSHYMDIASRKNAIAQLRKWVKSPRPVIMDIGCSSGFLLRQIREQFAHGQVLGADYVAGPLRKLAGDNPDWPLLQFDLTTCPLPDACLDAINLSNVLEHIGDDVKAVQQTFRMLRPGGVAVVEVPAGPHLFDIYDKQLMHFRRYTLGGLVKLLAGAGFQVHDKSHIGCFLYPAFSVVKKRNKRHLSLPDTEQRKIVQKSMTLANRNPLMNAFMSIEQAFRYTVPYPFGIRCAAVGVKPE